MCESSRQNILDAILNDAVIQMTVPVETLERLTAIIESPEAFKQITMRQDEYTNSVKVAWQAGFAEAKHDAASLIRRTRDAWRKPVAFNYRTALSDLLAQIEGLK
jgi:hypothetical protein